MKQRDLLLTIIGLCEHRPEFGRTSLQKVAFFVADEQGVDLGYRPHYFGPFSNLVEEEIRTLVLMDMVEEKIQPLGFIDTSGFAGKKYEYHLSASGRDRFAEVQTAHAQEFDEIRGFLSKLESSAGGLDQRVLSPAAKCYFIIKREKRAVTTDEIRENAAQLGWQLDQHQIDHVGQVLEQLHLIQRANMSPVSS